MQDQERNFETLKRIVVKVGTSTVAHSTGKPNLFLIESIVRQLADLHNMGKEVALVTSGAIGTGAGKLGLSSRPKTIPDKQAAAAVGQGVLMHIYEKLFAEYGVTVGQVLLIREDFSVRRRFLNARSALNSMFKFGVIPIINENDTVAVDEIKFGDNDNLSALVASLIDAELLLLLSDIKGLFTADPRVYSEACLIKDVNEITTEIESFAGGAGTKYGTGGMATKLQAVKKAMHSGVITVLASSKEKDVIRRIIIGEQIGTVFWPTVNKMENRKRWIAYGSKVSGKIIVDHGAARALLENGKSLLPSGVTAVEGCFDTGNTVSIVNQEGREIARGIAYYSSDDVNRIKGARTDEIQRLLGYKDYDEIVHRNNLVMDL